MTFSVDQALAKQTYKLSCPSSWGSDVSPTTLGYVATNEIVIRGCLTAKPGGPSLSIRFLANKNLVSTYSDEAGVVWTSSALPSGSVTHEAAQPGDYYDGSFQLYEMGPGGSEFLKGTFHACRVADAP